MYTILLIMKSLVEWNRISLHLCQSTVLHHSQSYSLSFKANALWFNDCWLASKLFKPCNSH